MKSSKIHKFLVLSLLILLMFLPACRGTPTPSRWDDAQEASTGGQATLDDALPGSAFNKFFPKPDKDLGFDVVYTQEKNGFAEAKLKQDGEEIATLSVSDTANNPSAVEKFKDTAERLAEYPIAAVGSKGTAILVADRFQVQVRSKSADFDEVDREHWLQEFDLDGLANLK